MKEKYGDAFEIIFQKKFWPHIDGTGGFFVAKIRKTRSLNTQENSNNPENEKYREKEESKSKFQITNNKELRIYRGNISPWNLQE
jgi:hypothetical protein